MSKSLGNTIHLSDSADDVKKKVMRMYTDPKRVRADMPGTVEGNPVFIYHDAFNPDTAEVDDLKARYRAGKVGDVEVKTKLATALNAHLDPIRERRAAVLAKPEHLRDILFEGSKRPARVAADTMARVRDAMKIHVPHDGPAARLRIARPTRFPVKLVELRGAARSAAAPHQEERGQHLRHSDRAHHRSSTSTRIHLMQELNLDVAGDFLVMAATLIHIKSKMLLPRPETAAGVEGEEEDPRDALVRRLLEHQKFKAAAELLHEREQLRVGAVAAARRARRAHRRRRLRAGARSRSVQPADAFQAVVERAKHRPKVLLPPEQMPVEVRIEQLLERLSETEACGFEELFADVERSRRTDRDVSRAARDDSAEAGARLPGRQLRADSRLQARAAGRCAASDWRSGERS